MRPKNVPSPYREPTRNLHPLVHALRKQRYALNLTAEQVADKLGIPVATIQCWESGRNMPSVFSVQIWADALNLKLTLAKK